MYNEYITPASFGIDGNTNQDYYAGSCSYTAVTSGLIWWKLDLGSEAYIDYIIVYTRLQGFNSAGFIVTIGNNPNDPTKNQACKPLDTSNTQTTCTIEKLQGRYIFIYLISNYVMELLLCEFKVFGHFI